MGWSQALPHKGITEAQVNEVLDAIEEPRSRSNLGLGFSRRQTWGWHCECDVWLSETNILFSGSWTISGNTTLPERFAAIAKELGLDVGELSKRE